MKVLCYTSFTFSYLGRARVLARSVRRHHPEWELVALITDLPPAGSSIDLRDEDFDRIVHVSELGLGPGWLFKHDLVEACTAVKGPFLHQACAAGEADAVIYLDPDMALLDRLDPVIEALADHDIVLTPHLLDPEDTDAAILDNEISVLRHGIYNLGFLAVRTGGEGARFARWWSDRLTAYCYDDIPSGLFVDQRWCDHVPALFDRVKILRDAGLNIASWNLSRRKIRIDRQGRVWANDVPARLWHFTKLGPVGDAMTRRYAGRNFEVYEIWNWYRREIEAAAEPRVAAGYWAYGAYADGQPIERAHRLTYRDRTDLSDRFVDPYSSGTGSFQAWLIDQGLAHAPLVDTEPAALGWTTPLWAGASRRPAVEPQSDAPADPAEVVIDPHLERAAQRAKAVIRQRRSRREAAFTEGRAAVFTDIWSRNLWGSAETRSGPGSLVDPTAALREFLADFIERNDVRFVYDAPCGDFNWMRLMRFPPGVRYLGLDIVAPLIERNRALYGSSTVEFARGDIVSHPPPEGADLWLCRHALFHLTGEEGVRVLHRWRSSNVSWFLATTTPSVTHNVEVETGGWRPLNLERPPFNLSAPYAYLSDTDIDDPDRKLGVWRR